MRRLRKCLISDANSQTPLIVSLVFVILVLIGVLVVGGVLYNKKLWIFKET